MCSVGRTHPKKASHALVQVHGHGRGGGGEGGGYGYAPQPRLRLRLRVKPELRVRLRVRAGSTATAAREPWAHAWAQRSATSSTGSGAGGERAKNEASSRLTHDRAARDSRTMQRCLQQLRTDSHGRPNGTFLWAGAAASRHVAKPRRRAKWRVHGRVAVSTRRGVGVGPTPGTARRAAVSHARVVTEPKYG